MKRAALFLLIVWLVALPAFAGTPGIFRGVVVDAPAASRADGWIFVKGKNGMMRKVEIKSAVVHYEETFPAAKRKQSAKLSLKPGSEVRITATQESDGEWHASDIEIIDPASEQEIPPDPDPNHRVV
ncbi:MAG: hypothetical protein ROO76_18575 [Terriglobia bacterium]|nr:hypothetical protein [Terriglobia bacterium]